MIYHDWLYGKWELPDFIEKIVHTKPMIRLRAISQASGPACFLPINIPSRFQHCLGACFLAFEALKYNRNFSDYGILLPLSALLHDAGNPPFSHLSEPFLKEITGKDGESFLENILDGSDTEKIIRDLGIASEAVVRFVTGEMFPFSNILHGSLDLDNLDNISRFNKSTGMASEHDYDAPRIASAFRFMNGKWALLGSVFSEAKKWQKARKLAYKTIYTFPHLDAAIMLYRAVELAFLEEELKYDFFLQDDYGAVAYLLKRCNKRTRKLVDRFLRWQ